MTEGSRETITAPRLDRVLYTHAFSESSRADSPKVALLTNIFTPYKEPLLAELATHVSLHVYYCAERESNRHWPLKFTGGYDYTVLPGWSVKVRNSYQHFNPTVARALRQYRPDVLIVGGYSYPTPLLAAWTARRMGIPCLLWSGSTRLESSRWRRFTEPLKRLLVPQYDGYIAYTQHAARYLEDLGARRDVITIAPVTVDTAAFKLAAEIRGTAEGMAVRRELGIDANELAILFVGEMIGRKGGDLLLRAVETLTDVPFRLLMVGTGPEQECWQRLARDVGVENRVGWLGYLDQGTLARVYAVSDILVLPSRSEPSGNVINEAMAAGLTVIISDRIGTDVVQHGVNGLLFAAGHVGGLADCLRALARDPDWRARLGSAGQQRVCSEFTVERQACQFLEALRAVLPGACLTGSS
jgi:glycosyltransferase involved in cell wall biosynthesis